MEFPFKKHVSIMVDLEIGEQVKVNDWGPRLNGKTWVIEDIKLTLHTESSVSVKINGYESYIDAGWITKINK